MKIPRIKPLTRESLVGVWSALILPWSADDTVDENRFIKEIHDYAASGISGVYTGGTTGEFYAQDDATFLNVTEIACREAHAIGLPVQIGVSALSTLTVIKRIKDSQKFKPDAYQIALPFWLELKDDEVKRFVTEVAAAAGTTPIVLYITDRSKRKIAPKLLGELARIVPTFIGTKDTGLDVAGLKASLDAAPDLAIFGGEDFFTKIPAGGRGGYCSVTGFNAKKIVELYNLCATGRLEDAKPLADTVHKFLYGALVPMVKKRGLWDSAIDRIQRVAGGGDVGLRCQSPYRSGTEADVKRVVAWCRKHTPELLPPHLLPRH